MKHCATCSAETPEFAIFCAHCGNAMSPLGAPAPRNEQLAPAPARAADVVEKLAIPEVIEPGRASPAATAVEPPEVPALSSERNLKLARLALVLACIPVLANLVGLLLAGLVMRRIGTSRGADPKSWRTARLAAAIAAAGLALVGIYFAARACPGRSALRAADPDADWVPPALKAAGPSTPAPVEVGNPERARGVGLPPSAQ